MLPVWVSHPDECPVPKWRNWQTRVVQVHVLARVWGFESLLRHQSIQSKHLRLVYLPAVLILDKSLQKP